MQYDFDGIDEADIFEKGQYLPAGGKFRLKVHKMLVKKTRKSGPGFIAEFTVVESSLPEVTVGGKRTWFQKLNDKEVAYPAIMEFMGAVLQYDPNNKAEWQEFKGKLKPIINEAANYEGSAEEHPLHGSLVDVETHTKTTQNDKEFTVHTWSIVPEDD